MTQQIIHQNGCVLQWQDTEKFNYAAPSDGVQVMQVTPEQWENQDSLKWVVGGVLTDMEPQPPEPTLGDLQQIKINEVNAAFAEAAAALTDGYPEAERMTWATQQSEALAWKADENTPTPYLDGLALARGIPAEEMRQKTLDQTQLFMDASQQLVGKRQRLRDLVYEATAQAELDAIQWDEPAA